MCLLRNLLVAVIQCQCPVAVMHVVSFIHRRRDFTPPPLAIFPEADIRKLERALMIHEYVRLASSSIHNLQPQDWSCKHRSVAEPSVHHHPQTQSES